MSSDDIMNTDKEIVMEIWHNKLNDTSACSITQEQKYMRNEVHFDIMKRITEKLDYILVITCDKR